MLKNQYDEKGVFVAAKRIEDVKLKNGGDAASIYSQLAVIKIHSKHTDGELSLTVENSSDESVSVRPPWFGAASTLIQFDLPFTKSQWI